MSKVNQCYRLAFVQEETAEQTRIFKSERQTDKKEYGRDLYNCHGLTPGSHEAPRNCSFTPPPADQGENRKDKKQGTQGLR